MVFIEKGVVLYFGVLVSSSLVLGVFGVFVMGMLGDDVFGAGLGLGLFLE